jgi:hypothetical protein
MTKERGIEPSIADESPSLGNKIYLDNVLKRRDTFMDCVTMLQGFHDNVISAGRYQASLDGPRKPDRLAP